MGGVSENKGEKTLREKKGEKGEKVKKGIATVLFILFCAVFAYAFIIAILTFIKQQKSYLDWSIFMVTALWLTQFMGKLV